MAIQVKDPVKNAQYYLKNRVRILAYTKAASLKNKKKKIAKACSLKKALYKMTLIYKSLRVSNE
tara:strand:+ start:1106 stop:1297 length:192 start_codon:yes stop_codon:yes gene_type:complete